jgi:replication initiation and membrane attachment protein DnaB
MGQYWLCDNCGLDSRDTLQQYRQARKDNDFLKMSELQVMNVKHMRQVFFEDGNNALDKNYIEDLCWNCNNAVIESARKALEEIRNKKNKNNNKKQKKAEESTTTTTTTKPE